MRRTCAAPDCKRTIGAGSLTGVCTRCLNRAAQARRLERMDKRIRPRAKLRVHDLSEQERHAFDSLRADFTANAALQFIECRRVQA